VSENQLPENPMINFIMNYYYCPHHFFLWENYGNWGIGYHRVPPICRHIYIMPVPEQRPGNHHRYDGDAEDANQEADFTVKPLARCQAMRSALRVYLGRLGLQMFAALPSESTYMRRKMNDIIFLNFRCHAFFSKFRPPRKMP
jgi:hypothetical protein